jgi:hypothetical protein
MNNKLMGVILLSVSGLVAAIGISGAQIAYAVVLAGFYAGNHTGTVPAGPEFASPHWIVVAFTVILAVLGLFFLIRPINLNNSSSLEQNR